VPTPLEAAHDFLWRVHSQVPPLGMIGIFNRSHYEDVLSPRVHKLMSDKTAEEHMDDINGFESMLADNGVVILKFFLHISHAEQTRRLKARLDNKAKHWKISDADFLERRFWKQYQKAYDDILSRTSRKHAPWFVIPADDKNYRNIAISEILVSVMQGLKLTYPRPHFDPKIVKL
jgi:PPK2 family polyphosphate:nucleotide phosphotransferase